VQEDGPTLSFVLFSDLCTSSWKDFSAIPDYENCSLEQFQRPLFRNTFFCDATESERNRLGHGFIVMHRRSSRVKVYRRDDAVFDQLDRNHRIQRQKEFCDFEGCSKLHENLSKPR